MAQAPDQIMSHIEAQRAQLARNVDELQGRLKEEMDWRVQYQRHPEWFLAGAAFGGMLLSAIFIPKKHHRC
jgi:hypothetical protein